MEFSLNEETKRNIEKATGIDFDVLVNMETEQLQSKIEKKIKKKLRFKPFKDQRLVSRGSIYLYLNRLFNFNNKRYNKYIDSLKTE